MYNDNEVNKMDKKQTLNLIWKSVLEDYEKEFVEFIFPELTSKIEWGLLENLEKELLEIQSDMDNELKGIESIVNRLIKASLKGNRSIILFIHMEMENEAYKKQALSETMFRYFNRIYEKFRYEYNDDSIILSAAIYSSKCATDKNINNYKENESFLYNFKSIDIGNIDLEGISDENPLKLVFKALRSILEDEDNKSEFLSNLLDELYKHDREKSNSLSKEEINKLYRKLTAEHKDIYKKLASK